MVISAGLTHERRDPDVRILLPYIFEIGFIWEAGKPVCRAMRSAGPAKWASSASRAKIQIHFIWNFSPLNNPHLFLASALYEQALSFIFTRNETFSSCLAGKFIFGIWHMAYGIFVWTKILPV